VGLLPRIGPGRSQSSGDMNPLLSLTIGLLLAVSAGGANAQTDLTPPDALDLSAISLMTVIPGIEGAAALSEGGSNAALGTATVSQHLEGNRVVEGDLGQAALIEDTFSHNSGIVSVNQDAGNVNNQANVRVIALAMEGAELNITGVDLTQTRGENEIVSSGVPHTDSIVNSFNDTSGIVGVNQTSGNLNQQANVLVLAAGLRLSPEVALLDDHSLGEVVPATSDDRDSGEAGLRSEAIVDSFNNFSGVAQVSQSAGNQNDISNVIGISFNVMDPL